jgi:hypothetical protein
MSKVYLLTGGDYSDYTVYRVYSNESEAKRVADALHLDVEEHDLDPPAPFPESQRAFQVVIRNPAHPDNAQLTQFTCYRIHEPPPDGPVVWTPYKWGDNRSSEWGSIWARSEEDAIAYAAHRGYKGP